MELCSLHPFDEFEVREFVGALSYLENQPYPRSEWANANTVAAKQAFNQLIRGEDRGPYALTYALARNFASRQPSFSHPGISLTTWEARVDRGVGMLMRPPSRLLIESGLDPVAARRLPIRLEMGRGMMGGAYIPARLIGDFEKLLHAHIERTINRLTEAGWDGVAVLGMMIQLADYVSTNGLGIYEAMDVITDVGDAPGIPGASVVTADRSRLDKPLRTRLELAAKPPKKPGLLARLSGRGKSEPDGSIGERS